MSAIPSSSSCPISVSVSSAASASFIEFVEAGNFAKVKSMLEAAPALIATGKSIQGVVHPIFSLAKLETPSGRKVFNYLILQAMKLSPQTLQDYIKIKGFEHVIQCPKAKPLEKLLRVLSQPAIGEDYQVARDFQAKASAIARTALQGNDPAKLSPLYLAIRHAKLFPHKRLEITKMIKLLLEAGAYPGIQNVPGEEPTCAPQYLNRLDGVNPAIRQLVYTSYKNLFFGLQKALLANDTEAIQELMKEHSHLLNQPVDSHYDKFHIPWLLKIFQTPEFPLSAVSTLISLLPKQLLDTLSGPLQFSEEGDRTFCVKISVLDAMCVRLSNYLNNEADNDPAIVAKAQKAIFSLIDKGCRFEKGQNLRPQNGLSHVIPSGISCLVAANAIETLSQIFLKQSQPFYREVRVNLLPFLHADVIPLVTDYAGINVDHSALLQQPNLFKPTLNILSYIRSIRPAYQSIEMMNLLRQAGAPAPQTTCEPYPFDISFCTQAEKADVEQEMAQGKHFEALSRVLHFYMREGRNEAASNLQTARPALLASKFFKPLSMNYQVNVLKNIADNDYIAAQRDLLGFYILEGDVQNAKAMLTEHSYLMKPYWFSSFLIAQITKLSLKMFHLGCATSEIERAKLLAIREKNLHEMFSFLLPYTEPVKRLKLTPSEKMATNFSQAIHDQAKKILWLEERYNKSCLEVSQANGEISPAGAKMEWENALNWSRKIQKLLEEVFTPSISSVSLSNSGIGQKRKREE